MKNVDKFAVGGQVYDVLSPATFGDYMETIGSACINPDGYAENKLFLAYDDNVQKLFRATAAIAYSELLIKNTNCEPTTMAEALANALSAGGVSYDNSDSGLTASNVQGAIDEVNGNVETVNNDLSNKNAKIWDEINANGAINLLPNKLSTQVINGLTVIVSGDGKVTISGTCSDSTFLNLIPTYSLLLRKGTYKLTGCPNGGGDESYRLNIEVTTTSAYRDKGSGIEFTLDGDTLIYAVHIKIGAGTVITTPITFKPMISLASLGLTYNDFVPYANTNRDLTDGDVWEDIKSRCTFSLTDRFTGGTLDTADFNIYANKTRTKIMISGQMNCGDATFGTTGKPRVAIDLPFSRNMVGNININYIGDFKNGTGGWGELSSKDYLKAYGSNSTRFYIEKPSFSAVNVVSGKCLWLVNQTVIDLR